MHTYVLVFAKKEKKSVLTNFFLLLKPLNPLDMLELYLVGYTLRLHKWGKAGKAFKNIYHKEKTNKQTK